jgi:hypothetical protein
MAPTSYWDEWHRPHTGMTGTNLADGMEGTELIPGRQAPTEQRDDMRQPNTGTRGTNL